MTEEEEALEFVREHIGSVSTLELLVLLQRDRDKSWTTVALVRELRSSQMAVTIGLTSLRKIGLAAETSEGAFAFMAASSRLAKLAVEIKSLYSTKPIALIKATMAGPREKLRIFSDAFKFKD